MLAAQLPTARGNQDTKPARPAIQGPISPSSPGPIADGRAKQKILSNPNRPRSAPEKVVCGKLREPLSCLTSPGPGEFSSISRQLDGPTAGFPNPRVCSQT